MSSQRKVYDALVGLGGKATRQQIVVEMIRLGGKGGRSDFLNALHNMEEWGLLRYDARTDVYSVVRPWEWSQRPLRPMPELPLRPVPEVLQPPSPTLSHIL